MISFIFYIQSFLRYAATFRFFQHKKGNRKTGVKHILLYTTFIFNLHFSFDISPLGLPT